MYICLHVKYLPFLSDLKKKNFMDRLSKKNTQISNCMKIRPLEPRTDGRTVGGADSHNEVNSRFLQFWESA